MKIFATDKEKEYQKNIEKHLKAISNKVSLSYLVNNFAKYAKRQEIT